MVRTSKIERAALECWLPVIKNYLMNLLNRPVPGSFIPNFWFLPGMVPRNVHFLTNMKDLGLGYYKSTPGFSDPENQGKAWYTVKFLLHNKSLQNIMAWNSSHLLLLTSVWMLLLVTTAFTCASVVIWVLALLKLTFSLSFFFLFLPQFGTALVLLHVSPTSFYEADPSFFMAKKTEQYRKQKPARHTISSAIFCWLKQVQGQSTRPDWQIDSTSYGKQF